MSWRTAAGRAGKRHVKRIEWTEAPIQRPPSMAIAARKRTYGRRRRMNRRVAGLIGLEYKFIDQVVADSAIANTWTGAEVDPAVANCIGACVQGTSESQRDGSRIMVKSIQIQGYVERASNQDQADCRLGNIIHVALVMDRQTNGVQLSAEEVFGTTDPEVPGRRVVANTTRFRVLKSWVLTVHDTSAGTDGANTQTLGGMIVPFRCFIKMNQPVTFVAGAGAGTVADFRDVSFHMIACKMNNEATDTISYNSRVRFVG